MYCNVVCKFAAHLNGNFEPKRKISKFQWKSRVFLKLNLIVRTYLLSCSSMNLDKWKSWLNIYKKLKNHLYLHAQNMFSYFSQENFRWIHRKKIAFFRFVRTNEICFYSVEALRLFLENLVKPFLGYSSPR